MLNPWGATACAEMRGNLRDLQSHPKDSHPLRHLIAIALATWRRTRINSRPREAQEHLRARELPEYEAADVLLEMDPLRVGEIGTTRVSLIEFETRRQSEHRSVRFFSRGVLDGRSSA
jgi:hypothetical protein